MTITDKTNIIKDTFSEGMMLYHKSSDSTVEKVGNIYYVNNMQEFQFGKSRSLKTVVKYMEEIAPVEEWDIEFRL